MIANQVDLDHADNTLLEGARPSAPPAMQEIDINLVEAGERVRVVDQAQLDMREIDIDLVKAGERLRVVDQKQLKNLEASIKVVGVLNPITVYRRSIMRDGVATDGFGVIAGHTAWLLATASDAPRYRPSSAIWTSCTGRSPSVTRTCAPRSFHWPNARCSPGGARKPTSSFTLRQSTGGTGVPIEWQSPPLARSRMKRRPLPGRQPGPSGSMPSAARISPIVYLRR